MQYHTRIHFPNIFDLLISNLKDFDFHLLALHVTIIQRETDIIASVDQTIVAHTITLPAIVLPSILLPTIISPIIAIPAEG